MSDNKLELRVSQINLKTNDETLIVEGLVNKTESWSQMLGTVKRFKEKIAKGAFQRAIERAPYIDFLAEHDKSKILATTTNDSLELFEDEEGLKMRARIAPTSYGKDFYTLIKENIVNHMSFGFSVLGQEFKRLADGTYERTVTDLKLFEVSAVRQPAYLASAINARGIDIVEEIEIPDEVDNLKNEDEEDRSLSDEILNNILEQLKVNNSLLEGLKIAIPQEPVKEDEPKENVNPVQEEDSKNETKEEPKEEVISETPKEELDNKTPEEDTKPSEETPKEDTSNIESKEPEVKDTEEVVDLSTQKNILNEILKGEEN